MYLIDVEKQFLNTTIKKELCELVTGTNQIDFENIHFGKDKKNCQINVRVNCNVYYINLDLEIKNNDFFENGFNIEITDDTGKNLLEFSYIKTIISVMNEYWRCVRPDINA